VEKGLLEEEGKAGVTRADLTGAVVVPATGKPRAECGMMAMTFASSANRGAHPGHYAFVMCKCRTGINS